MSVKSFDPQAMSDTPVSVTPSAIAHFRRQLQKDQSARAVRLSVKESGCTGFMYVIDERCKTPDKPEQKDIIGSFEVQAGVVLKDTYVANSNYHFISEDGLFQLPAQIERVLFMALV